MTINDHSMPDAGSLLDGKQFKSMADALGDDFGAIIDEFFESCESFKNRLDESLGDGDVGRFRKICHEIKGASGLIGFRAISAAAADWEATAASGQLPADARLIETFKRLLSDTRAHVGSLEK